MKIYRQILKSDGTDVVFGDLGGATNVYYVSKNGVDAAGRTGRSQRSSDATPRRQRVRQPAALALPLYAKAGG